ncbi:GPI-anchor transamidase subunit GAA1, partial [Tremellales sp. Uapishka_1]
MLSRFKKTTAAPPPDQRSVNYSKEHVKLAKTLERRAKWTGIFWDKIPQLRADRYLDVLGTLVNATFRERSEFLVNAFSDSGISSSSTKTAVYAHIIPPRSSATETILLSANWMSRDGGPNLRGIAMLLSLGDFLQGQNHWAFDFVLVVGEGYMEGLEGFMQEYHSLFPGVIWTALNLDYPGHSFSHIGLFYGICSSSFILYLRTHRNPTRSEGVNGRLPNQDIINTVSRVARHTGNIDIRYHNIPNNVVPLGPSLLENQIGKYILASTHLLRHFFFMALGRASASHGVLAKHRIDSITLYMTPTLTPHGFHALGRTLESSLRSLNNLLERLHASYFFYLLPLPEKFVPVGNYLPAAILLGASITIGGFDCPSPLTGLVYLVAAFVLAGISYISDFPGISLLALMVSLNEQSRRSLLSLCHLLYGALIPTLAMVNFPQAIVLALITSIHLSGSRIVRKAGLALHPSLVLFALEWFKTGIDLEAEYTRFGNLTYPAMFALWIPLWIASDWTRTPTKREWI